MFTLFGFYQLLLMMLLLQFEFPQNYVDFLSPFDLVTLDFSFLKRIPTIDLVTAKFDFPGEMSLNLDKIGVEENTFLNNYFPTLLLLVLLIFIHLAVSLIYISCKASIEKSNCKKKIKEKLTRFF